MQKTTKEKRRFSDRDSVMIVAVGTIASAAEAHAEALQEADTTYTPEYFKELRDRIYRAANEVLGADNAAKLREASTLLNREHEQGLYELGLTKTLIENKYSTNPERRDELLIRLGFNDFYNGAVDDNQVAMVNLLARFDENLTADLQKELQEKGLSEKRIGLICGFAATYSKDNITQEGRKEERGTLTENDIKELNGIYAEIIGICRMGQRVFRGSRNVSDRFVYDRVVRQQSSWHNSSKDSGTNQPATS